MKKYLFLFSILLLSTLIGCEKDLDISFYTDPFQLRYLDIVDDTLADIDEDGIIDLVIYHKSEITYVSGDTIPYTSLRIKSINDSLRISSSGLMYSLQYNLAVDSSLFWKINYRLESYIPFQPDHENTPYIGLEYRKNGQILYGWIKKPLNQNEFTEFAIEKFYSGQGTVLTGKSRKE